MTGMEHAIEQVTRIIHGCTGDEDGAPVAARALAEAGLLAHAPLREEWATRFPNGHLRPGKDRDYDLWWKGDPPKGVNVRRYVSDWMPADPAEGDGSAAEREPTVPASQLRAFARLCVDGGDMTPVAARMLDRIIDGDGRAEK